MSEISDLESRITAALDRIRRGISANAQPVFTRDVATGDATTGDSARLQELEQLLDEEKQANAQLEERVRALKERQDGRLAELEQIEAAAHGKLQRFERDLNRLREVNAELRDINGKLRVATQDGVTDPQLVNRAMQAELDALRAVRAADAAEVDAVLEELKPLIEESH